MEEKSILITITDTEISEKSPAYTSLLQIPPVPPTLQTNEKKIPVTPSSHDQSLLCQLSPDLSMHREQSKDDHGLLSPSEVKPHALISHRSFEGDLESQIFETQQTQASASKTGLLNKTSYDPMWPNRYDLKQKRKAIKRERACCSSWAGLSRKQRGIISTIVILVVLGAGLSVGFGISKCVGGGVVNSRGPNSPVLFH